MNIGAQIFLTGLVIMALARALIAITDSTDDNAAAVLVIGTLVGIITATVGAIMWIWML